LISTSLLAQSDSTARKNALKPGNTAKGGDHFMLQLGRASWQNKPDTIRTKGLSRTFNAYFLFDFPFKTNPRFSVAIGPGIATDNIILDKMTVGIIGAGNAVVFDDVSDTSHFKKYKLTTAYLEAPVELRFAAKPNENKSSFKFAIGAKVGTLLSAGIKGKNLESSTGGNLPTYTLKEKNKRFFNNQRLSLSGRVGYGPFSVFASYSVTSLFKEGAGPQVRPVSIGLTISGL
jgi:hypothetical protein